jgi:4-phosphopantoate--beta-alanine ligase
MEIFPTHPRAESLRLRKKLAEAFEQGIVIPEGLTAHGRGEAFDYLLGEATTQTARRAAEAGVALLLLSSRPVISVNGNAAALVAPELVKLAKLTRAKLEVNLFHPSPERERKIAELLIKEGADEVLGTDPEYATTIPEIQSHRRKVDRRGIAQADTVLVPLEDGDRTQALRSLGKKVIAIDLNPLSRTSLSANITIVDNIVRALPLMVELAEVLKDQPGRQRQIIEAFDNRKNLAECLIIILERLQRLSSELGFSLPSFPREFSGPNP